MKKNYLITTKRFKIGIKLIIFAILNNILLLSHENTQKNNSHIHYQLKSRILTWINFELKRTTINKFME